MNAPNERELFEIAAYRVSPETWNADAHARVERWASGFLEQYSMPPSKDERDRAWAIARKVEAPHNWQYNEVVAWVRLIWDGPGPVIKGYLWEVSREKFRRGFIPHPFRYAGKVVEVWGSRYGASSPRIFASLRDQLVGLTSNEGALKKRHLDLRAFDAVGPFVDWCSLITPTETSR